MREYLRMLDDANNNAEHETGSSWDVPHIYTAELRANGHRLLDEADRLIEAAGYGEDSLYSRRVQMKREILQYTDAFCDMMETRARHDWKASHEAYRRLEELREHLATAYDPPAIMEENGRGQSASRFTALFGRPTEDAFERIDEGGRFVAGLDPEWDFLMDRFSVGEDAGYYRGSPIGGNWNRYDTRHSWSDHGLHHYLGEAWYRQKIFLPEDIAGERVFLWFVGAHNQLKVWVNGQEVGISPHQGPPTV
jgi:Beta-galactosidase/beta-glucuronidase